MTAAAGTQTGAEQGPARTPGQVWRIARSPVLMAVALLVAATLVAIAQRSPAEGTLDPRAPTPDGSRAVAEVLRGEGVEVRLVTTSAAVQDTAGPGDTVFVAFPDRLVGSQQDVLLATGADLVLGGVAAPEEFVPGVERRAQRVGAVRAPGCNLPTAQRAGSIDTSGALYGIRDDADDDTLRDELAAVEIDRCYRARDGGASLIQVRSGGRAITFLGNPGVLTNDQLDEEGHAALALGLLGAQPRLLWYIPSLDDVPEGEGRTFFEMMPTRIWWGVGQLLVAVLLLALWRGRRLGPVVVEPLPVIVRAAETVEGRARLYRRARARDKAADAVRAGVRDRLLPLLGLPRAADPAAVIDAVAARSRRTGPDVAALLYGSAPADDAALVRLADDLDALEREVRRP